MAIEPDIIPDIYHYCDRWCERCSYTSRCLQFRIEAEEIVSVEGLQEFDALNARFWQDMGEALVTAIRLIRELAAKEGIEPDELQNETTFPEQPVSVHRNARQHPCASAALFYTGMVNEWFAVVEEESEDGESLFTNPPKTLEEPVQVIRHYQYFIYPKIVRAAEGRIIELAAGGNTPDTDVCGTAKIALIAIDRSLAAWSILYREFPSMEDRTLSILLHLDRLRRSVEVVFPSARAFIRPGFD